jgi:hypothetical protein
MQPAQSSEYTSAGIQVKLSRVFGICLLLFCGGAFGHDLLVLRQYGLLDHIPGFSVDRKSNNAMGAIFLLRGRKRDKSKLCVASLKTLRELQKKPKAQTK